MMFARRSHGLIPMWSSSRRGRRPSRARGPGLVVETCEGRTLLSTALVTLNAAGTAAGNSVSDFDTTTGGGLNSGNPSQSPQANLGADGTKLVFASEATDLVGGLDDTNHASDVFVRDLATGRTTLVSATPSGRVGNGASFDPVISPDGRYVAFLSDAANLSTVPASPADLADDITGPNNQTAAYLYVRDLATGTTTLMDQTPDGVGSDGFCTGQFVFSPNGQYLAFIDTSDNLTGAQVDPNNPAPSSPPGWSNPASLPTYVYVRDLAAQATSLVSVSTGGMAAANVPSYLDEGEPFDLAFSPDSQSLVFDSAATDLTDNLPNNEPNPNPGSAYQDTNLFLRNLSTGTTTLLSATAGGRLASGDSGGAVFSPNGLEVAFTSTATDLTHNAPDTSSGGPSDVGPIGSPNIFVRNLSTGTTSLVSATPGGLMSDGYAMEPVFSPDGQSLAYLSTATDLTSNPPDPNPPPSSMTTFPGGMPSVTSVFPPTPTLPTDTTTAVSTLISTVPTATTTAVSPLTPSLPTATTTTSASPIVPPGFNVFLTNLTTGSTSLVSVTPQDQLSSGTALQAVFSPDGRYLAFTSNAGDLTNNPFEATPPAAPGASSNNSGSAAHGSGSAAHYSGSAAHHSASLSYGPTGISNVFVRDLQTGTTTLASVTTGGLLPGANSGGLIFSSDSGSLYFTSSAIDLTSNPPDTSAAQSSDFGGIPHNLFDFDIAAGTASLISATPDGQLSDGSNIGAVLSPDGQTLYFASNANDLVPGATTSPSPNIYTASGPYTTPGQFSFQSWETSAAESAGQAVITVQLSSSMTAPASVDYAVQPGTAQAGADYTATSGTLNFAPGQTSATFLVPLAAGDQFTGTRSAQLVLSNPQGGSLDYPSATLNLTSTLATPTSTPAAPTSTPKASTSTPAAPTPTPAAPTPTPTAPTSTPAAPTPTPTAPTPTPTAPASSPTPAATAPAPVEPGPTVVSVAPLKAHRRIISLIITFNKPLDPATAQDAANYQVSLPGRTIHGSRGHRSLTSPSRPVKVAAASYNSQTHQVTLALRTKLRSGQTTQLEINGTSGGVASADGVSLNSPNKLQPGRNYLGTMDLA